MQLLNQLLAINPNYILIGLMVLFYSLEHLFPIEFKFKRKPQHLFNNVAFILLFTALNVFWAAATVYAIEWFNQNHIGLFYLVTMPVWLQLLLSVILFDFVSYWFHRGAHVLPVVWRFHRVHHSDSSLDASSNFRGHPIEVMLWFGVSNIVAAAVFGLSNLSLGLYFLIVTPFFFWEHSNLKFPTWLDRTVGWVFTTPNFADIFILWDRVFGTFKYKPTSEIKFGLKEFDDKKKQTFWYLLKSPFINMGRISSAELRKQENFLAGENPMETSRQTQN
jgi:sterol desaturase/sphingolipid hydroxylase (fatty acid hydroxylase superfamily)